MKSLEKMYEQRKTSKVLPFAETNKHNSLHQRALSNNFMQQAGEVD